MEPSIRVLTVAGAAADSTRLVEFVGASGLGALEVERTTYDRAVEVVAGAAWHVLVADCPADLDGLARWLGAVQRRAPSVPVVLCSGEFSERIATLAQRFGASICVYAHGPAPLREAVLRAARRGTERGGDDVAASERVRALVYTAATDVIFLVGVEGERFRFLEINPAFTRATGLGAEQVIGRFVDEVIPEPSASLVLSKYRQAIVERRTVRWEETTEYPTGLKYGEVAATPVLDAAGRCTSIIGTVHDATDVRLAEEAVRLYADIASAVQIGLTVWKVRDAADPGSVTLIGSNSAADTVAGIALADRRGSRLADLLPSRRATDVAELVCRVSRDQTADELPAWSLGEARGARRILALKAFPLANARVGVALEDVTERERARALRAAEHRVLEMVASSTPLAHSLRELVLAMEDLAAPATASVLLLSRDRTRVRRCIAPHLPPAFVESLRDAAISRWTFEAGSTGGLGRSVSVAEIETDTRWTDARAALRELELRTCWSAPIVASNDRLLGVFALYHRELRSPSAADVELFSRMTHVASIAVERHELDEQLRELAARLEAAREEERTGIAREIHDELGQSLTAIKLDLSWIARRASASDCELPRALLLERLRGATEIADQLIQQVRRISAELRPSVLDDLGLLAAVELGAQEFERRTGIPCPVTSNLGDTRLDRRLSTAVFRTFQEALTNVARHANATRVAVLLEREGPLLRLEVRDDGKGIAPEVLQSPASLGLLGMRERARYVGGRADVRPGSRGGTVMSIEVPLRPSREEEVAR